MLSEDAIELGARLLYDLLARYQTPFTAALDRWAVIRQQHPAYATAERQALELALEAEDDQVIEGLARWAAGQWAEEAPRLWLEGFVKAPNA